MYRSKAEIEKKLSQTKYALKQLIRFEGRFFVNGGRDDATGSYPLIADLSSFLSSARSVFQYALEEAKSRGTQKAYDDFFATSPISKLFKGVRDDDIHRYTPGTHMTIEGTSEINHIDPETGVGTTTPFSIYVEGLEDLNSPKRTNSEVKITTSVTKRIEINDAIIDELELRGKSHGKSHLADAARRGEALYEVLECEGEKELFVLCRSYMAEVEAFVQYGIQEGFIT